MLSSAREETDGARRGATQQAEAARRRGEEEEAATRAKMRSGMEGGERWGKDGKEREEREGRAIGWQGSRSRAEGRGGNRRTGDEEDRREVCVNGR